MERWTSPAVSSSKKKERAQASSSRSSRAPANTTHPNSPSSSRSSTFKNALVRVPVPTKLIEGVSVLFVNANGKTRKCFLTISQDKFTLYITSNKVNQAQGSGSLLLAPLALFRIRSNNSTGDAASTASSVTMLERSVDIGSIARIQRGQITHKFELAKSRRDSSTTATIAGSGSDASSSALFLEPKRSFSIIFRGQRTLDFMVTDVNNRDEIVNALNNVIRAYQNAKVKVGNDVLLLRYIWLDVDKDKSNTINSAELGRVMERINFYMKRPQLHASYEKFAKIIGMDRSSRRKGLTFEQTCTFLHKIKRDTWMVKPVNLIWNNLFGETMNNGKPRTTVSDRTFLEKFLRDKQKEDNVTLEQVRTLFARLNQLEIANVADMEPKDPFRIDKNRFEAYLVSRENDAFDPFKERFDQHLMDKPLSEYWISTSHNTYLTGSQWSSHSSVEMYLNSLYRGCRCLELDIWDGEIDATKKTPVPIVYHGHTMTTKILFKDIIKSIKVFLNFNPDSFPIILSFENHCSIPYQEVMAEDLVRILGGRLYIPTESSLFGRLPSPQNLRGMVAIKGRRPDGTVEADLDDTDDESDGEDARPPSQPSMDGKTTTSPSPKVVKKHHKIAPQLAKLTLFHGTKYKSWDTSIRNPTHHMHSFSESKVKSLCRQNARDQKWTVYNQSHMTRTFPAGSRMDSSNYNPMMAWSTGCQLVALNFQTSDESLRLNDGRFRENGGCGYVLKPSSLMIKDDFAQVSPVKLSVRVLTGSCLPKPEGETKGECISPHVQVSVHDVQNEGEKDTCTSFCTNVVQQNGFFPIWNHDKFVFTVENGAVAMLQLTVYNGYDFIASASIPISCLRSGYRSVQLFDEKNTRSGAFDFASLLIQVKMRRVVGEI